MGNTTSLAAGRAAIALIAAGLLAAGCSSSSSSSPAASPTTSAAPASTTPMTSSSPAASGQAVLKTGSTTLGTVLVDSKGFTVYWFAKDSGSTSTCTGSCAGAWPPVTGTPVAASGVSLPGKLGTISRGGGVLQATYNGHPLYTFAGDSAPGQANGNGVNGFGAPWYAIKIGGSGTTSTPSSSSTGGGYGY